MRIQANNDANVNDSFMPYPFASRTMSGWKQPSIIKSESFRFC